MTTQDKNAELLLKGCPFCGSNDIDPEGVAAFKEEYRSSDMTWEDDATPDRIEHRPACNDCGATTDGDWNTRASFSTKDIKTLSDMIEIQKQQGMDDSYMRGMANGMIFAKSIIDGKEPKYVDPIAPTNCAGLVEMSLYNLGAHVDKMPTKNFTATEFNIWDMDKEALLNDLWMAIKAHRAEHGEDKS